MLAFDFPSQTMLAVYKRLQIEAKATMIRYAKPLRVDRKRSLRSFRFAPSPAGLIAAANAVL